MQEASIDVLLDYAHLEDCRFDEQLWRMCLELLPPKSPRRAEVLLRLEAIEAWCNDLQPSDS